LVDRYGEAIEWDLLTHCNGLDLLDFFRGKHSWRKLSMILERLPGSSAYRGAMLSATSGSSSIAAQSASTKPTPPAWSEYTPERAALDNILDRLGDVVTAVVTSAGSKPPTITPATRPITEVDRVRLRREKNAHDALVAEVKAAQERFERNRREG
jgi:hypothetical protein